MSLKLAALALKSTKRNLTREQILQLPVEPLYTDGRTKQCHADECDINKIMARFEKTGTISHLAKYEPVYGDFSDYDFGEQTRQLTKGREIFDALPGEIRREFNQNPQAFFDFVNDPANKDDLLAKLPALAKPGTQLPAPANVNDADALAASAAASEPLASETTTTPPEPAAPPPDPPAAPSSK